MEHSRDERIAADGTLRLAAHTANCDDCQRTPLPLEQLCTLLNASPVDIDVTGLSRRVLDRLRPELAQYGLVTSWRRVLVGVLLSLLPLPLVLAYDAYFLSAAYHAVSLLLPAAFAAYLVLSYAAFLVLLFALTYAAIPLLLMRGGRQQLSLG